MINSTSQNTSQSQSRDHAGNQAGNHDHHVYDVAVIGAGSAGLQAAQTLGRMHQSTVVLSTETFRNDPTGHMHNFLGHDGAPPAELRLAARKDADAYDDVQFLAAEVLSVSGALGAFVLELAGEPAIHARRVLLATGVSDTLPDIPGVEENFGDLVAHCPFCHGHEYAGTRVGILAGAHAAPMASMLQPIATDRLVLTHGADLDDDTAAALARLGADVETRQVTSVRKEGDGLVATLADGEEIALGGLIVKTDWAQAAPFADQLGVEMSEVGAIIVDAFGRTSVPGVYAAGDLAQGPGLPMPMASVLIAAAAGLSAAAGCVQDAAQARLA